MRVLIKCFSTVFMRLDKGATTLAKFDLAKGSEDMMLQKSVINEHLLTLIHE